MELDLEHYVVPAPTTSANSSLVYEANLTETPRSLSRVGVFSKSGGSSGALHRQGDTGVYVDKPDLMGMEVTIPDPSELPSGYGMVESKWVRTFSTFQKQEGHRGLFVDRGVGSPRLVKSASTTSFSTDLKPDSEAKMLGLEEDRHLAIVLVGLPARGKTFTAAKLTRYLHWLGHDTKHFNVGKVNYISGYLPGRIVFFLLNTHLTPRPIFLTRHGENRDNVRGRIGSHSVISGSGELYAKKLAKFVEKRLNTERAASIWTSTLQRTILTASPIVGFPKVQWRALDEINAGVCDGMTYEEIKKNMPEEYESRKRDKLRYRYPRGESYLDVIQRLEPVIIKLERQRAPVVVVSHQAVLRALYAYFAVCH
ncbi:hypothetical protein BUALT_Bualt13G0090300 [Buddleja alternifolia]|uniref:6-phosphofructo-2-kinase domain-containing protein n=1 Tax=Buddleja alternifolia TaxID=168488 RepID=A0AAV6WUE9_9LAMI|nr:hypothetical protein BUALT_Bualt13G0090300 [Buddleja alternifolia]